MPLQPTDVPSRAGIQAAIDEAVDVHASTTDTLGQHYDSGWINIPLAAGVSASSPSETPQYRRVGKIVHTRGRATLTVGTTSVVVGTIPAGFRPSMLTMTGSTVDTNTVAITSRLWITTAGVINVNVNTAAASRTLSVAMTFMID